MREWKKVRVRLSEMGSWWTKLLLQNFSGLLLSTGSVKFPDVGIELVNFKQYNTAGTWTAHKDFCPSFSIYYCKCISKQKHNSTRYGPVHPCRFSSLTLSNCNQLQSPPTWQCGVFRHESYKGSCFRFVKQKILNIHGGAVKTCNYNKQHQTKHVGDWVSFSA